MGYLERSDERMTTIGCSLVQIKSSISFYHFLFLVDLRDFDSWSNLHHWYLEVHFVEADTHTDLIHLTLLMARSKKDNNVYLINGPQIFISLSCHGGFLGLRWKSWGTDGSWAELAMDDGNYGGKKWGWGSVDRRNIRIWTMDGLRVRFLCTMCCDVMICLYSAWLCAGLLNARDTSWWW